MYTILRYLKNHQLVQFALIGGFIFLSYQFSESSTQPEIVVTQAVIFDLIALKSELVGHQLNDEEKEKLINNYIDEEVLLQEAYNQGLDRNDSKIRERLVDKMRFLMAKELEEPSEDSLIAFYDEHSELYLKPEYITFDQVYFKNIEQLPKNQLFLKQLEKADSYAVFGDSLWLGNQLGGYARTDLKIIFGEDFAADLFTMEQGVWKGPLNSLHGNHYVRIIEKIDAETYPYENVKSFVREDWSVFQSRSVLENQMNKLKESYNIRVLDTSDER